jgi:hypothetical protein
MQQPPMITYNLKERGRVHTGQERNFNIRALMDSINGPACQEKIKARGMLGYFGHKPRVLFGMEPVESGVVGGKYNEIEPALVTTYLEAFPDGTIKHQSEFLDSPPGKKAARMFANRIGGFSSAIDQGKNEFFGFDFVLSPNYNFNRGFSLDSTSDLTFDQVLDEARTEEDEFWNTLINSKDAQIENISAALDSVQAENEELFSLLVKAGIDSTAKPPLMPIFVALDSINRIERDKSAFRSEAKLPGFVELVSDDQVQSESNYNDILSQMGLKHV